MKPTTEDLRVAAEIADGSVVRTPTPHMSREKLVSRIASMRAAEREKAVKDGITTALAQLRETFPDNELTIDFAARPDGWEQVSIFRFVPSNFRDTILVAQGPTISEAMAAIRAGDKE